MVAAPTRRGDLGIYLAGLGSVTAFNTVTIRSRVDGELIKVAFAEGQMVGQGDLLAEIDPRPYEAQLALAEGQLAKDTAQLAQDAIRVDQGQIQSINLQLAYCQIRSPLAGRIGLRLVDQGNIVHSSDANGIATVTQLQPIAVLFTLPEDDLPEVLKRLRAEETPPVEAWDRTFAKKIATGKLLAVDNTIDVNTGTARFKAEFANQDSALFPNQFVNVRLLMGTSRGVVIAPAAAIQSGPQGAFVFVVKDGQTVELRNIVPGPVEGDDASVESGLKPGELVVVEGWDKLQPGSRVVTRPAAE